MLTGDLPFHPRIRRGQMAMYNPESPVQVNFRNGTVAVFQGQSLEWYLWRESHGLDSKFSLGSDFAGLLLRFRLYLVS